MESSKKSIYTRRTIDISKIKSLLNENSSHGCCGSRNLGNTCFMNSSIACLQNCIDLTTFFLTKDYEKELNKNNKRGLKGELAEEWYSLLKDYWINSTSTGNPSSFKSTISSKARIFRGYQQQDSNEFMTYFLDYINEDLNKVTDPPYEEIEEQKENESDYDCAKRFWDLHLRRNDSIITDLFSGQYKSTIECPECKWISITYDPFNTLILDIPPRDFVSNSKDITLFYVSKFNIRTPAKVMMTINKNLDFKDLKNTLENENDFKYKNNDLVYMNVKDKKFIKFCNDDEKVCSIRDYIFCHEKFENDKKIALVYVMCKEESSLSVFPRIIFIDEKTSFEDIKMNLYFISRKYINDPFGKDEDDDEFKKMLDELNDDVELPDDKIIEYLKKEYAKVFKKENLDDKEKDLLEKFNKDIPFQFFLVNDDKEISLLDNENLENELKELSDKEDISSKLTDLLINKNYTLKIEFNKKSSFSLQNIVRKFDICSKVRGKYSNNDGGNKTLFDCLEYFREEEYLEEGNEWYCKKCKKFQKAKKKMEIFYVPKILMICLKRFSNERRFSWEKNNSFIDFPINNMDLKDYVIADKENVKYDLYAVSQHFGGVGGGHYTAVCKNFGNWYNYNDSSCYSTNEKDVVSSSAYVLFYRRQTD